MAAFRSDRTDSGRENAAATDRTNGPGENKTAGTEAGEVQRYSIAETLKDDLQSVYDNNFDSDKSEVEIGNTSDFLVNEIEADAIPNYMPATKAYQAMATTEKAKADGKPVDDDHHYHGLGVEGLYELINKAETPVAAFADTPSKENPRLDRIVLVTDKGINGGIGIVIIQVNSVAIRNGARIIANKTVTVFDRQAIKRDVQSAYDQGRLLYIDKKRGKAYDSGRLGANCPTAISDASRKINIQRFWGNVKWENDSGSKTKGAYSSGGTGNSAMAEAFQKAQEKKARQLYSVDDENDAAYLSLAEKYHDGTASEADTAQLQELVEQAANKIVQRGYLDAEDR